MKLKLKHAKALQVLEKCGILLVYPIANRPEPQSLWSQFYPRSQMLWDWNVDGDTRVSDLWHLRAELSASRKVVYAKWFQNRATFFSFEVFAHLLSYLQSDLRISNLPTASQSILELLNEDSPLSTKQVKVVSELEGRLFEAEYNRAMKPLWQKLLIVGFGEFEDSSFPSLGIGSTQVLFEELYSQGKNISQDTAAQFLAQKLGEKNPFFKFAQKIRSTDLAVSKLQTKKILRSQPDFGG